ncbi:MAG: dihydropteroate synthase [Steroidobacteraceae bacterium]
MQLDCAGRVLDLTTPVVMGVLNVTPDSFSDGGSHADPDAACAHAQRMVEAGAAIIDIGGESTRPGAQPVALEEELRRVMPVIEQLAGRISAVISIDTLKPEVMRRAVQAGAGLINDVTALRAPGALAVAAESGAAVCLMHMQGEPRSMQDAPQYQDVVREVREFLQQRAQACLDAGVPRARICVDPGFGFGKSVRHNLQLLAALDQLAAPWPLAVGVSRKSMLRNLTGRDVHERLAGSIALASIAALKGARILRVHDVAATRDAMQVVTAVLAEGEDQDGT